MNIPHLRGPGPGAGGAGALEAGLRQAAAAVPEVDLEAGDGSLAADDHEVVHGVAGVRFSNFDTNVR